MITKIEIKELGNGQNQLIWTHSYQGTPKFRTEFVENGDWRRWLETTVCCVNYPTGRPPYGTRARISIIGQDAIHFSLAKGVCFEVHNLSKENALLSVCDKLSEIIKEINSFVK